MDRRIANALMLAAAAIWGLGFVAQSTAMDDIAPIIFTGLRFLAAAGALLPFAIWETVSRRAEPVDSSMLGKFATVGLVLFAAQALQQAGLVTTTVTNSGFLTSTYVLLVPIIATLFLRQKPHAVVWPCALAVLTGIYLLSGGKLSGVTVGDALTLVCAVFWAIHVVLIGLFTARSNALFALAFIQFLTCGLMGTAVGLATETTSLAAITTAMPEILFAGVISGGVAFTLQIIAQQHTTSSQAAIVLSTEALFAALFGAWLLGERLTAIGIAGCALIFIAILAIQLVPESNNKPAHIS